MSIEGLLLLAVFLLWPLIERMLRSAREQRRPPDQAPRAPRPASRPPVRRPTPPPQPSVEAHVPRTAEAPAAAIRVDVPRPPGPQAGAPAARLAARKADLVNDLHRPHTLRRAVVLMTILGPCRSVAPHDWGERQ